MQFSWRLLDFLIYQLPSFHHRHHHHLIRKAHTNKFVHKHSRYSRIVSRQPLHVQLRLPLPKTQRRTNIKHWTTQCKTYKLSKIRGRASGRRRVDWWVWLRNEARNEPTSTWSAGKIFQRFMTGSAKTLLIKSRPHWRQNVAGTGGQVVAQILWPSTKCRNASVDEP